MSPSRDRLLIFTPVPVGGLGGAATAPCTPPMRSYASQLQRALLALLPEIEQRRGEQRQPTGLADDVADERLDQRRLDDETGALGRPLDRAPQLPAASWGRAARDWRRPARQAPGTPRSARRNRRAAQAGRRNARSGSQADSTSASMNARRSSSSRQIVKTSSNWSIATTSAARRRSAPRPEVHRTRRAPAADAAGPHQRRAASARCPAARPLRARAAVRLSAPTTFRCPKARRPRATPSRRVVPRARRLARSRPKKSSASATSKGEPLERADDHRATGVLRPGGGPERLEFHHAPLELVLGHAQTRPLGGRAVGG